MKESYKTSCVFSGLTTDLVMHAIRNDAGCIIGWVFVNESISEKLHDKDLTADIKAVEKK
jgi:hypothetical protein